MAWWLGNTSDVRWMHTIRRCTRCQNFNLHQEDKVGEEVFGDPMHLIYPALDTSIDHRLCTAEDRAYENEFSNQVELTPTADLTDAAHFTCPRCYSTRGSVPSLSRLHSQTPTSYLPYHMSHQT